MFAQSLIHADWTYALWSALVLLAAFGFWADTTKLGSTISGIAATMAIAMLLSNFGILPKTADAYGIIWSYLVPLAIPLLLLKADLRRVISETGGMLIAFFLGAFGTTLGAILGFYLLPLGEEAPKLAGVFSATYIGGSMNMAAVSQAVSLDPAMAIASVAADNVVGVAYLAFLAMIPSLAVFRWWFRFSHSTEGADNNRAENIEKPAPQLNLQHLGVAIGLSFAICAVAKALAEYLGVGSYSIMFITAITLLIANIFPKQLKNLQGDYDIGQFFMYLFFVAIGVSADVVAMMDSAMVVALYALIIVVSHAIVIFGASRFFKLDLFEVVIASNACAAGPAPAAALAAGRGRHDLVAPAVLLGVFGYAVANFIGIMLATSL